jgi:hypothetical protein
MKITIEQVADALFLARAEGFPRAATASTAAEAVLKILRKTALVEFEEIDQREGGTQDVRDSIADDVFAAKTQTPSRIHEQDITGNVEPGGFDALQIALKPKLIDLSWKEADAALHAGQKVAPQTWTDGSYLEKGRYISGGHWDLYAKGAEGPRQWPVPGMQPAVVNFLLAGKWRIVETP